MTARILAVVIALGAWTAIVASTMLFSNTLHPLHYSAALAVICIALLLAELVLACVILRDRPLRLLRRVAAVGDRSVGLRLFLPFVGVLLFGVAPANLLLLANQGLDGSAGAPEVLPVRLTSTRVSRGGRTYYYADVEPTAHAAWRFGSDPFEKIEIPRATWMQVELGRSTLTLVMHPGVFGFPWYERDPVVTP